MVRIASISFDQVPGPKGAAVHIEAFAKALAAGWGPIDLVTAGRGPQPIGPVERWPGVRHIELPALGPTLIDRVLCFRNWLGRWLVRRHLDVVHFRSIYEGFPLLKLEPRPHLVFEVNGLPSIELKYRYPSVADDRELMRKLIGQEQRCLREATRVVTPSSVTRSFLIRRGVPESRIDVIPNGVDLSMFYPGTQPAEDGPYELTYFGTLAAWQGVHLAVRAAARIQEARPARLHLVGPGTKAQQESVLSLAAKLGIGDRVIAHGPMPQAELALRVRSSHAILAPLIRNDRNVLQGCCPLKVLEGMASGVPVITSDLAVVRELGEPGRHFLTVKPGSVEQIAQAVLRLQADPAEAARIGAEARARIEERFTWEQAGESLRAVYATLESARSKTA